MDELKKLLTKLQAEIGQETQRLKIYDMQQQLNRLQTESQAADFWQDSNHAQGIMQQIAKLESCTKPWQDLQNKLKETADLIELNDASLQDELTKQLNQIQDQFNELKEDLKFKGPADDHDAILTLSAGAGGTDAQDWTQMLFRMYVRWAENNRYKVTTVDE